MKRPESNIRCEKRKQRVDTERKHEQQTNAINSLKESRKKTQTTADTRVTQISHEDFSLWQVLCEIQQS